MCMSAASLPAGIGNAHDVLCLLCKLMGCNAVGGALPSSITTIDLAQVAPHQQRVAAAAGAGAVHTQLHVMPGGGQLITSAAVAGNEVKVPLQGSIGGIPFDLELLFTLDLGQKQIRVKLTVREPIAFEHEWIYNLGTVLPTANGVMASGLQLAPATSVAGHGIDFLCILKCGGLKLLPILITCLPALAGGVPGFVACVAGRAGAAAADIAVCIAQDCIKG